MEEKKTSIIALLKILEKYSDEDHILRQSELLNLIESEYGIKVTRKTLYRNVEMLNDFGYEISNFNDNEVGYYLKERQFEKSEILYLVMKFMRQNLFLMR